MSSQRGSVDLLIMAVLAAAGHLAECKDRETELDGQRALLKVDAIARIMASGAAKSATSASDLVMTDDVFAAHELQRRAATSHTIRAMGEYKAACYRAEYAIKISDLEIISDDPLVVGMGKDHAVEITRAD